MIVFCYITVSVCSDSIFNLLKMFNLPKLCVPRLVYRPQISCRSAPDYHHHITSTQTTIPALTSLSMCLPLRLHTKSIPPPSPHLSHPPSHPPLSFPGRFRNHNNRGSGSPNYASNQKKLP